MFKVVVDAYRIANRQDLAEIVTLEIRFAFDTQSDPESEREEVHDESPLDFKLTDKMCILEDKLYADIVQTSISLFYWWVSIPRFIVPSGCGQHLFLIFVTYPGILNFW